MAFDRELAGKLLEIERAALSNTSPLYDSGAYDAISERIRSLENLLREEEEAA